MCLLISCEGGGEAVPPTFDREHLASVPPSCGVPRRSSGLPAPIADLPARWAARRWAAIHSVPLVENPYRSDLINVGRSLHHRQLFGPAARGIDDSQRAELIETVYRPFRHQIETQIDRMLNQYAFVVHLAIKSFPLRNLKGKIRRTDVGMLYDPARDHEMDLCLDWIDEMYDEAPMLKVRRNYPGRGVNDSLTKAMREKFRPDEYLGIELWLNQAWVGREVALREEAFDAMTRSLSWITNDVTLEAA